MVRAHLNELDLPNVFQTRTLDDMLRLSIELYKLRQRQGRLDTSRAVLRQRYAS